MKLKKLLAGITAAALAVSAMAFSSLTASAVEADIWDASINNGVVTASIYALESGDNTEGKDETPVPEYVFKIGDLIPEGSSIQDLTGISVNVESEAEGTWYGGGLGGSILKEYTDDKGELSKWGTANFSNDSKNGVINITNPYISADTELKLGLWWKSYKTNITVSVKGIFEKNDISADLKMTFDSSKAYTLTIYRTETGFGQSTGRGFYKEIVNGGTYADMKDMEVVLEGITLPNLTEYGLTEEDIFPSIAAIFRNGNNNYFLSNQLEKLNNGVCSEKIGDMICIVDGKEYAVEDDSILTGIQYFVMLSPDKLSEIGKDLKVGEEMTITINAGSKTDSADDLKMTFKSDQPYEITIYNEENGFSQSAKNVVYGIDKGKTYKELKNSSITVEGIKLPNLTEYGLKESDIRVNVGAVFESGTESYHLTGNLKSYENGTYSAKISDMYYMFNNEMHDVDENSVLKEIVYYVMLSPDKLSEIGKDLKVGEEMTITINAGNKDQEETTDPDDNKTPATPSAPAIPSGGNNTHQGVGMPPAVITNKTTDTTSAAADTAASGSTSVELKESTKLSKDVIDSVSGKESVELKLTNGASWEIAGADAAKAEGMDLGITLDTKTATAAQLKDVAKDKDTFQFSIRHNGDFGFKAVVNIPINKKYNGQFANLYWFHDGKFDFVGSSKVEDGIADFTMTHASDYVIVFDEEAYGEDVSSGAGVYEESETSAAPAAIVVTFAALAVSAVILKKKVF